METTQQLVLIAGTSVEGNYLGDPFKGVLIERRTHSINWNRSEAIVELTQPLVVAGVTKPIGAEIIVATDWAGNALPEDGWLGSSIQASDNAGGR